MKLFRRMYEFSVFVQVFLFMMFILENLYNLDNISFSYNVDGNETEFSFNFYTMLAVVVSILLLAILMGLNFFGAGLNEEATQMLRKYLAIFALFAVLFVCSNFYLLQFGLFGIIINLFFTISYMFKVMDVLGSDSIEEI